MYKYFLVEILFLIILLTRDVNFNTECMMNIPMLLNNKEFTGINMLKPLLSYMYIYTYTIPNKHIHTVGILIQII